MLYLYLVLILICALGVIVSKNIIQSVINLIIVFFLCSLLIIHLGADFIGLIILIVYIGAISILFLFIVMMLNIRMLEITSTFSIYLPLAIFISIIFISLIILIYVNNFYVFDFNFPIENINWLSFNNIKIIAIGELLFNEVFILFIGATLLLFVAMIGAILLTLEKKNKINYIYRFSSKNINWKY